MDIAPGIMAVIARSSHEANVGVLVHVLRRYQAQVPLPPGQASGWWVITSRTPLIAFTADLPEFALWSPDGKDVLARSDDLLALRGHDGEPMRWRRARPSDSDPSKLRKPALRGGSRLGR
ncbi:hypothetical protein [Pseudorhodoferax sp. Leaf265]|jgi:hypothetical protein|uniref:hypothetical protein n=1 Tax=Pseudorhodoferax sp. Leaf265 TaxID=1736315 RepID=UPI0006F3D008|nr:hypothetical protein [Pseudorhodoferax sp. Leaf265]KQP02309.1 hypothetical protein ASF45_19770 [Pseudorhodoferax sp. Leaf265]PZP94495.1 MAG: hypothetical protein DI583_25710 [Variovorax paradoxus]PZQ05078.1 MAG: hypothetical protein DI587_25710 [Variovorax paradoxus]